MKIDEMAESKNEAIVKQKSSSWPKTTYNFHHRSACKAKKAQQEHL